MMPMALLFAICHLETAEKGRKSEWHRCVVWLVQEVKKVEDFISCSGGIRVSPLFSTRAAKGKLGEVLV